MTHLDSEWYRRWKGWVPSTFGGGPGDPAYYGVELSRSGIRNLSGQYVLELGFGNGEFGQWVLGRGGIYCGTELDDVLVERAKEAGVCAYPARDFPQCVPDGRQFDLIAAWDVFEHISREELLPLLITLRGRLAGSGVLIARVPSGDSPFGRAIQYGDLTHVLPMGSGAIRVLAARAGFSGVDIRPVCLPLRGRNLRSAIRRIWILAVEMALRPILVALMRNPDAITTPNMIITLRP